MWATAAEFQVSRGFLQQLLGSAAAFAASVAHFCKVRRPTARRIPPIFFMIIFLRELGSVPSVLISTADGIPVRDGILSGMVFWSEMVFCV